MRLVIQLLLIVALAVIVLRMVTDTGDRTKALRRVGIMLFAVFAIYSVLFPNLWTRMARKVGVGRGTDLLLYVLVVAFLAFVMSTFLRFRDQETRYTRLARRIALDEAAAMYPHVAAPIVPDTSEGNVAARDDAR